MALRLLGAGVHPFNMRILSGLLTSILLAAPVAASHAQLAPPPTKQRIYDETGDPRIAIAAALKKAKAEHKNVILDFGGDWCGDCQVLYIYMHRSPNKELLEKNFVLVPVWIGHIDTNLDIPAKYGVNIKKGVPALAVISPSGKTLHAQANGEFENMRNMPEQSVTDFLNQWKP